MLTFNELTRWTGVTLFELDMHLVALFCSTALLTLKWHWLFSWLSFLHVFSPLFIASALNLYFLVIVFVRAVMEDHRQLKRAVLANAFNFLRTIMVGLFELLLCHKVQADLDHRGNNKLTAVDSPYWVVFLPVWVLLIALSVHACRLL